MGAKRPLRLERPQGRFMDAQNYKKLSPKVFDFYKILKIHENKIVNPQNLLLLLQRRERDKRLSNNKKLK